MTNPLDGLRVIDLSGEMGALCGRVLADLGADVILVEPPGGSVARAAPPLAPDGTSLSFAFRNAGKRGITLDICTPDGRADLHRLLDTADVWIESHAPGVLAQRGLDPAAVLAAHPSLVLTSITDFGQSGPHCGYLGTDLIGYAMGGMLYRAGAPQRPPVVAPGQQAYDTAAVTAACATMAALLQRRQTGNGQWLDISVQEATSNLADWSVPLYSVMGFYGHREGAGMYPVYRCADGWVRLIVLTAKHWRALRAWMGEPPELQDPIYDEFLQRLLNRQTIEPVIQGFFAPWKKEDAARDAQAHGIPATPVLQPAEVIDNAHTRARGTFVDVALPSGQCVRMPSGFYEWNGARLGPRRPAPRVGEHDAAVAAELAGAPVTAHSASKTGSLMLRQAQHERELPHLARNSAHPELVEGRAEFHVQGAAERPAAPFAGLRVIDFGIGVAGVEVGRLLAEHGAHVIKVESSRAADFIRQVIPGPMNPPFASSNRSKLSFGVNLKSPVGVELARRLVRTADVVIENSATGVMERLGLGYADLQRVNPRVIMFSTQMLGSAGPWKTWSGYGPNAHAVSGLQYLWNYPEDRDKPEGSTNIHPDHLVGRLGALAVGAALWRRERDGVGAHIQVAQFEALIQLLGDLFMQESLVPGSVQPRGNRSDRGAPWGVYPCAGEDEWCAVTVRSDAEWRALCAAMGSPAWACAAAYDTVDGRRDGEDAIDAALGAWTREQAPFELMHALQAHGVPAAVVEHPVHQVSDPHLQARAFFYRLDQVGLGPVTVEGTPFRGSRLPAARIESAPLLGQHTRAVCRTELGMSDAEIDALFADGVLEEPVSGPS